MERVAKRANARRLKRQRRARRLVEKNKREAEQVREREKARRLKNAAMLLDGKAFDVKKKKFWFETGWTAERFMEPLNGMENEAEEEGAAIFDAPSSRLFARRGSNAALPGSPEVAPATPRSQETPQTSVEPGAGVPPVHRSGDLAPLNKKGSGALRPTSQFDWGLAS